MPYAVILSNAAQTDLDSIVQYVAVDNPTAAEKLGLELIDVAMSLETLPYRGTQVRKNQNVRKLIHSNYVITYRIVESNQTVQVLGFTHCARIK
ncbi:MAG: type II toxin-antitoxin system RelE/ParE family toxin [Verrucomicrobia bacterium]|nr:type II toxin-antitoxin system RelE/ParE family toxin [Verrucomicrobiota bacterium]